VIKRKLVNMYDVRRMRVIAIIGEKKYVGEVIVKRIWG